MNRKAAFALTFVLALVSAAPASAGSFSDAGYQGHVERDRGTFFGFDVAKKNGKTKIKHIVTLVKLNCDNHEAGPVGLELEGSLAVNDKSRFRGTLRAHAFKFRGGNPPTVRVAVAGKLQRKGKAAGTEDVSYDFISGGGMRGGEPVHCYSGNVDWRAERGATVNPEPPSKVRHRLR